MTVIRILNEIEYKTQTFQLKYITVLHYLCWNDSSFVQCIAMYIMIATCVLMKMFSLFSPLLQMIDCDDGND